MSCWFKDVNIDYFIPQPAPTSPKEMTIAEACKIWNSAGIMSDPKYWENADKKKNDANFIANLERLIVGAAKKGFK